MSSIRFHYLLVLITVTVQCKAQSFTRVTDAGPLVNRNRVSIGCSWGDVNNDGWMDLFSVDRPTSSLYINRGDGTFEEVTDGHLVTFAGFQNSAIWGDYNNDGYNDLYVNQLGPGTPIPAGQPLNPRVNFLYRNIGPPTYELVRDSAGVLEDSLNMTWTSEWADLDNDGDIDLLVPGDQRDLDFYFENLGDGTFSRNESLPFLIAGSFSAAANMIDMDTDGDLDVLVVNFQRVNNELYRNLLSESGELAFESVNANASDIVADRDEDLSPSWGDYDNDGDLDAFLCVWSNRDNELYRNDGDLVFTDVVDDVVVNDAGWSLGNAWLDYDNDGDLDLFVPDTQGADRMYRNDGQGHFERVPASELGDLAISPGFAGGCAVADYDNDGDLDIYVPTSDVANSLFRNENDNQNHWLNINCRGSDSNRTAIGARVTVSTVIQGQSLQQMRYVLGGPTGDRGQSSQRLHFGLGDAAETRTITAYWPSGRIQHEYGVKSNQFIQWVEGTPLRSVAEPLSRLLYAWLSNNAQFSSLLIVNNPNASAADLILTARRGNGDIASTERSVQAGGFLRASIAELFPTLGDGSGVTVLVESENLGLKGRWVTNNLAAGSGQSPSQGVAVDVSADSTDDERFGEQILYGFLPVSEGLTSAPVVVNTGDSPIDVSLEFINEAGETVLLDETTLVQLAPLRPFAVVANTLLPPESGDVMMIARSDSGKLTGCSFVFNHLAEPAIGNVSSLREAAATRTLIYPWLSSNNQFESILIANNLGTDPVEVTLTARRAEGDAVVATRTIAGRGFLKELASDLFPELGSGSGFSVVLESQSNQVRGRWVTNNLQAPSGRSPSQGVAVAIEEVANSRIGETLLFGFMPVTSGLTSAPVVVNMGEQATDVALYVYNQEGALIAADFDSLQGLQPLRPFAAVINQIVETDEDVMVIAQSSDGSLLTGVGFVFNQFSEPAIGNVSGISFSAPVAVGDIDDLTVLDQADQGDASDLLVSFAPDESELGILEYRVFFAPTDQLIQLNEARNLPAERYMSRNPTGATQSFSMDANLLDAFGQPLTQDVSVRVYALSVANQVDAHIDRLAVSDPITASIMSTPVTITYISNEGVMVADGTHKVLIDAVHRTAPGNGWIVPPLAQMTPVEVGQAPYDNVDVIMVTHNHGDHYSPTAIGNYLAANPNTKLLAPPQVRQNFTGSPQVLTPTPALGQSETVEVNGMTIEVLHARHFNIFGNDFSGVENYVYLVHMGGKKLMHFGDVDMVPDNISVFGLASQDIDLIVIPTFSTLVSAIQRDTISMWINPRQIVAAHLLSGSIDSIMASVLNFYPDAWIFTIPFEQLIFE